MNWKLDPVYKTLEGIAQDAGIRIQYQTVTDDRIDGEIWARADCNLNAIMMPADESAFPDTETACLILGHEIGHILSTLESTDEPAERRKNEAICDLIGYYLFQLALRTYETKIENAIYGRKRDAV